MIYRILADFTVLAHFVFILFVVFGGLLVLRWPRLAWAHVPVFLWGALIELFGWVCPLTPLEHELRRRAGGNGYEGGFIEHYLTSIIYPEGLSRTVHIILGLIVLVINLTLYAILIHRSRKKRNPGSPRKGN